MQPTAMPERAARTIVALFHDGGARASDAVNWAISELEAGNESDTILRILGLANHADWTDIEPLMRRAFAELGYRWIEPQEANRYRAIAPAVQILRGMESGELGIIEASRRVLPYLRQLLPGSDPDLVTFIVIESETDHLPVGDERQRWNKDALHEKDVEINRFEKHFQAEAKVTARRLIDQLSAELASDPSDQEDAEE